MIFALTLILGAAAAVAYAALSSTVSVWGVLGAAALGFLAGNVLFLLVVIVNALLLKPLGPDEGIEKQHPFSRWLCTRGARWLTDLGGARVRLSGLEKLPEGPFLLVGNHRSMFDPLIVMGWLGKYNIAFVSKPSNLKIPFVGLMARRTGFLGIDRENDRAALKTILQAADYLKRGVCSVGIYPEGTRNRTQEPLLPFHAGSFKIAQRAGVPVAVVCMRGTENIVKLPLFYRTPVTLEVLELIEAETVKRMKTVELAEQVRALLEEKLREEPGKEGKA